jgi:hypothetical protein
MLCVPLIALAMDLQEDIATVKKFACVVVDDHYDSRTIGVILQATFLLISIVFSLLSNLLNILFY